MEEIVLSREQIHRAEKLAAEIYGIPMLSLMKNAGRATADAARRMLKSAGGREVTVIAGKGNNGGDGFAAARRMHAAGCRVTVYHLGPPDKYTQISFTNFQILHKIGITVFPLEASRIEEIGTRGADLLVDGIFGIGVNGAIREFEQDVIRRVNDNPAPVLSIDIPSGLDADTGEIHGAAVKAETTVSLGFLKKGFYKESGPAMCGEVILADIGYPKEIYEHAKQNC